MLPNIHAQRKKRREEESRGGRSREPARVHQNTDPCLPCVSWVMTHGGWVQMLYSISFTGGTQKDWERKTTCWQERGGKRGVWGAKSYDGEESLVLYASFNALWARPLKFSSSLKITAPSSSPLADLGNTPIRARTLALWPLRMGNNSRRRAGCQCHRGVAYESLRALESLLCPVTLTPTSLPLYSLQKGGVFFSYLCC